jgi:uncharacterized protein (DUF305 family)
MLRKKFFVVFSILFTLVAITSCANSSVVKSNAFPAANSSIGTEEVMFAQMMIPHHQQAIQMSKFALTNTSNSKILTLARNIIKAQTSEIVRMNRWLKMASAGVTGGMDMEMQGMLTDQQLKTLGNLKGSKFDQIYLSRMIFHHQGAVQSVSIIANSQNIEAKALAGSIKSTQNAEISAMESMLAAIK